MDQLELISSIFSVCNTIYGMVETMKTNKERCQRIVQRVKAIEDVVLTIQQRGPGKISSTVVNALNNLCVTLNSAKELIMKYSRTKAFKSFLMSNSQEGQLCKINERLTDNFQVLSGALQVEHGNMLCKVYDSVSGIKQNEPPPMPTAPIPLHLPIDNPTPFMHHSMPLCHPTTPIHSFAGPGPVFIPPATQPTQFIMPTMQVSLPSNPMCFRGTMAPLPLSTSFIPQCVPATMSSFNVSPTTAMPLIRPVTYMTVSPQNTSILNHFLR